FQSEFAEVGRALRIVLESPERLLQRTARRGRFADSYGEKMFIVGQEARPKVLKFIRAEGVTMVVASEVHQPDLRRGRTLIPRPSPRKTVAAINQALAVGRITRVIHLRKIFAEHVRMQVGEVQRK